MDTSTLSTALHRAGPFATVLADVSQEDEHGRHQHELRVRAAAERLAEQGAPADVVDLVTERLDQSTDQPAPVGRIVIATPEGIVHDQVALTRVDQPVATWGPLPDLAVWIAHQDATLPFVLALVDHEGGEVSLWESDLGRAEFTVSAGGNTENIHKKPTRGPGAVEIQRRTEDIWRRNADEVATELTTVVREHGHRLVLLGGDPTSVALVRKALGDLPVPLVELPTGQRHADGGDEALRAAIHELLAAEVTRRRTELAHRVEEGLGRGDTAVAGVDAVAEALVRRQVETLVVDPAALSEVTLNPNDFPGLSVGAPDISRPVRADQALIAAAIATDAVATTLPSIAMHREPVAAILRWEQGA